MPCPLNWRPSLWSNHQFLTLALMKYVTMWTYGHSSVHGNRQADNAIRHLLIKIVSAHMMRWITLHIKSTLWVLTINHLPLANIKWVYKKKQQLVAIHDKCVAVDTCLCLVTGHNMTNVAQLGTAWRVEGQVVGPCCQLTEFYYIPCRGVSSSIITQT